MKLFEEVGLLGRENDNLKSYSQGMKKRFALAVSLISNPKNFVFDEVLNGLDPQGIQFFRNLALKMKKKGRLYSSPLISSLKSRECPECNYLNEYINGMININIIRSIKPG